MKLKKYKVAICECCKKEFQKTGPTQKICIECKNKQELYLHEKIDAICPKCGKEYKILRKTFLKKGIALCKSCNTKESWEKFSEEKKQEIKNKTVQTNLKKYGVEHPYAIGSKEFLKNFASKHNGLINASQLNGHYEKCKKTLEKKYGSLEKAYSNRQEKINKTIIENYGSLEEYRKYQQVESKKTLINKYGVENIFQLEEVKDKSKKTSLNKYGVEHPAQSKEIQEKINKTIIENYGSLEEYRKYQQAESKKTFLKKIQNGYKSCLTRYKYIYNDFCFDSSWELAVWIYANDNNIEIIREPCVFKYNDKNNKEHFYIPDFKIDGKIIEIKGDYQINEDNELINIYTHEVEKEKTKCMYDNIDEIWTYEKIKPILNYIKQKYGLNYLKQFRQNPVKISGKEAQNEDTMYP